MKSIITKTGGLFKVERCLTRVEQERLDKTIKNLCFAREQLKIFTILSMNFQEWLNTIQRYLLTDADLCLEVERVLGNYINCFDMVILHSKTIAGGAGKTVARTGLDALLSKISDIAPEVALIKAMRNHWQHAGTLPLISNIHKSETQRILNLKIDTERLPKFTNAALAGKKLEVCGLIKKGHFYMMTSLFSHVVKTVAERTHRDVAVVAKLYDEYPTCDQICIGVNRITDAFNGEQRHNLTGILLPKDIDAFLKGLSSEVV